MSISAYELLRLVLLTTVTLAVVATLLAAIAGASVPAMRKVGAIAATALLPVFGLVVLSGFGRAHLSGYEILLIVFGIALACSLAVFAAIAITVWILYLVRRTEAGRAPDAVAEAARMAQVRDEYRAMSVADLERVLREAVLTPEVAALCRSVIEEKRGKLHLDGLDGEDRLAPVLGAGSYASGRGRRPRLNARMRARRARRSLLFGINSGTVSRADGSESIYSAFAEEADDLQ
jgi:hypothetical protein